MRLSIIWRMEMKKGVMALADNILRELHNSLYDMKAEFNNFIVL